MTLGKRLGVLCIAGLIATLWGGFALAQENDAPVIEFQDILDQPADIQRNYFYAVRMVESGELSRAAGALERILLTAPNLHDIRLFYAVLLYRLDSYQEAEAELSLIAPGQLSPELQSEYERYQDLVMRRASRLNFHTTVTVGMEYDTNVNATPSGEQVLVFDLRFPTAGEEDDIGYIAEVNAGVDYDLGLPNDASVFGQITGYINEQVETPSQDIDTVEGQAGVRFLTDYGEFAQRVRAGHLRLSSEQFYDYAGVGLSLNRFLRDDLIASGEFLWTWEEFRGIFESPTADDRTGHRFDLLGAVNYVITPSHSTRVEVLLTSKYANKDFEAYDRAQIEGSYLFALTSEQFFRFSAAFGHRMYDAPDTFFSGRTREDTYYRLRGSYGVTAGTVARAFGITAPKPVREVILSPGVEYLKQNSSIINNKFDNLKVTFFVSKFFAW